MNVTESEEEVIAGQQQAILAKRTRSPDDWNALAELEKRRHRTGRPSEVAAQARQHSVPVGVSKPLALTADDLMNLAGTFAKDVREFVHFTVDPLKTEDAKLGATLAALAEVCEQVPKRLEAIEQRVRALEGGQHG